MYTVLARIPFSYLCYLYYVIVIYSKYIIERANKRHNRVCIHYTSNITVNLVGQDMYYYFHVCRCVKSEYTVQSGIYDLIWNDRGSGADRDVSLFANTNIDSADGIGANTFTAISFYGVPSGRPSLLRAATARQNSPVNSILEAKALVAYHVSDTEHIWDDGGSGADRDFSSWRAREPRGYFSLGDVAVPTHSAPRFSILVRPLKDDALKAPTGYRQRWTDAGSGADDDVAFYEPICPPGYRALGHVTVASHSRLPSLNDIRCVKSEYTVPGKFEFVWNDGGSGADRDVSVYTAVPSGSGQGVRAMSARPCHCWMDRTAYVLNSTSTQYIVTKPVKRYILKDISYKIDSRQLLSQTPDILATTSLTNEGFTLTDSVTRVVSYSYAETHTWSQTLGLEIGISATVTAGVPEVSSSSVCFSI